jgi:molecular chaperone Hsp33
MHAASATRRFLLENLDIRGQVVRLAGAWQAIAARRDYAPAVRTLLGEFTAVGVMVGAGLKHPGRALLQVSGPGPIRLLVADCTDQLAVRAMIRMRDEPADPARYTLPALIGESRLALTIENATTGQMHQSIVPVEGLTVAEAFEQYFDRSEQVPTHLWISSAATSVTALILQKMPRADERDPQGWARVQRLAATGFARLADDVAARASPSPDPQADLLATLFPDDDIRLYESREVRDGCARNEEKVVAMLKSLGREEVEAALAEQGEIVVHDEICNQEYRFGPAEVSALLD